MKQLPLRRMLLLYIVTLGLYNLYWLDTVGKQVAQKQKHWTPSIWLLLAPYITFFVAIFLQTITGGDPQNATTFSITLAWIMILSAISAFFITPLWFIMYSRCIAAVSNGKFSWLFVACVWLFAPGVWPFIIQNEFNHQARDNAKKLKAQKSPAKVTPKKSKKGKK